MAQRQTNFLDAGVTFGATFLADHAGQLMQDGRLALTELVANAYDAGASSVRISGPTVTGEEFSIEDDGTGMTVELSSSTIPTHAFLYGEDQARYVVATGTPDVLLAEAGKAGVPAVLLGYSGGSSLVVKGLVSLPLSDIKVAHEAWLPTYMNATD